MGVADVQGSGEGVGTTGGAVTVAASIRAVVSSAILEESRGAQVEA